jgi:hypothetical protein
MQIGLLYWILMLIWLVFGLAWNWPGYNRVGPYGPIGNGILLFILLLLLGWKVFGEPLHG